MRRCHVFRPAVIDALEVRLVPSSIAPGGELTSRAAPLGQTASGTTPIPYASNVDSPSARAGRARAAAHARAVAHAMSQSNSIDWHKLGDQVHDFFFGHHKTTHAKARSTGSGLRS
jgi:hypothetical protein